MHLRPMPRPTNKCTPCCITYAASKHRRLRCLAGRRYKKSRLTSHKLPITLSWRCVSSYTRVGLGLSKSPRGRVGRRCCWHWRHMWGNALPMTVMSRLRGIGGQRWHRCQCCLRMAHCLRGLSTRWWRALVARCASRWQYWHSCWQARLS